jgi:adenylate cyclase
LTPGGWRRAVSSTAGRALLLGVLVSLLVTAASRTGALAGWETRAVDLFLFFRDRVPTPAIVLVLIDEAAFEEMGERQPLPRRYLAELGEFLLRSGARVVAFDIHVAKPTRPEEDATLVELTQRWATAPAGRVVLTTVAKEVGPASGRYVMAPPYSAELRSLFGYANAPLGADGQVRRMLPVMPAVAGGWLPSFALAALAAYRGYTAETLTATLADAGAELVLPTGDPPRGIVSAEPVPRRMLTDTAWRVDFAGPPGSFASFPAGVVMQAARSAARPEGDNPFRDRIVLVGATFAESRDFYPTPLGLMAGVEIQAHMVHTLLARRAVRPPHWAWNLGLMVLACAWMALLSTRLRGRWVALGSLAFVVVLVLLSYEAYHRGYWLDFVAPLAVMLGYHRLSVWLARRRLRKAFGEFVTPDIMERVLREGARVGAGEVRPVSILMSDVRGFTTLSEKLPPDRVSETMNEYFTAMVDVIMRHRGMVQDFIGDGILVVYGAPVDDPDHGWHAVQTALGMQAALRRLNAQWSAQGRPTLAMGAAVNSGRVFAGVMGAPQKKKYTVLGDVVNTTSRMEGQNRELGTEILISETTLALVHDRVVVKDRGIVKVKGKAEPVVLFELLATAERPASGLEDLGAPADRGAGAQHIPS